MEVSAKDIVDSVDLGRSEVLLPIYESIVNSIISLYKTNRDNKQIDVYIDRIQSVDKPLDLFDKKPEPIMNVTVIDNGEGFTDANFKSFHRPFSQINKQYGCKGVGRFTILALFKRMDVCSIYKENDTWKKRSFSFDAENEIHDIVEECLDGEQQYCTKVMLVECKNQHLFQYTAKNAEEIAKGVMDHCLIYYLSGTLPHINIIEQGIDGEKKSLSVESYFRLESKEKEKSIRLREEEFKLYIIKSNQTTTRKYNYVSLCANSRKVGGKRDLSKVDSLYTYPITEGNESKYLDVYVVSPYLDRHINNQRTGFTIPESNEVGYIFADSELPITIEEIMRAIASEVAEMYTAFAQATKRRNIAEVEKYILNFAPQYRSLLKRNDVLDSMPPNLSDEKKDEYLHRIAYQENKKIDEKIDKFIKQKEVNDSHIKDIVTSIKEKTAYNSDTLAEYVFRRNAILRLFEKMLDRLVDGHYELESMIHNLIFPMGLTNLHITYQYHNLWLLDDRFSTFKFIASDRSITSFSQIRSSKEPDLVLIDKEENLVNNAISFGSQDAGEVETMVIFEFKRPGDTAHQKRRSDYRWEFSELVEKYFDDFLFGTEKDKKNYRGNIVKISKDTPKFGYVVMDEMPDSLIDYNRSKGWRKTPFGSYYKINPDQNLHIEAITFQGLLKNARKRNNPFFDKLFAIG